MAQATVLSVTGNAVVVQADGSTRALKVGDAIQKGETIRTANGARVELMMEDGQVVAMGPTQTVRVDEAMAKAEDTPAAENAAVQNGTIEQITQVLEQGGDLTQELEAAAAGAGAGGGGDGSDFVRLLRVTEGTDPLAYDYTFDSLAGPDEVVLASEPAPTEPPVTEPPVTEPPVTEPPVTEPPVTEPPVTEPPATEPPPPENQPPVIDVVANDFTEDAEGTVAGAVAGTYTVSDEDNTDDELVVSFTTGTNTEGYYELGDAGEVLLTEKGAAWVNAGNELPAIDLTVTDPDNLTGQDADTPEVTLANDPPSITTQDLEISEEYLTGATTGIAEAGQSASGTVDFDTASVTDPDNSTWAFTLDNPSDLTSGGLPLVWSGEGTDTLTGKVGTTTVVTVTVDDAGKYTVTLSGPVDHHAAADADDNETPIDFTFDVIATDAGNAFDTATVTVSIIDDTPTITSIEDKSLSNAVGSVSGDIVMGYGGDGEAASDSLVFSDWTDIDGITVTKSEDGKTLTATIDDADNTTPDKVFYTVAINDAGDGYDFNLVTPQPTETIAIGNQFGNGVADTITVNAGNIAVTFDGLLFDPVTAVASDPDNQTDKLNLSSRGFGIGSGNVNDDQGFRTTFDQAVDGLNFNVVGGTAGVDAVDIYWTAYIEIQADVWKPVDSGTVPVTGLTTYGADDPFQAQILSDSEFTRLDVRIGTANANDAVRIENFEVVDLLTPPNLDLEFVVTATDADGDQTTGSFTVSVETTDSEVTVSNLTAEPLVFQEASLADGSNPDESALSATGTLKIDAADGVQDVFIGGHKVIANGQLVGQNQEINTGSGQKLTITGFDSATGEVTYKYDLSKAAEHANANAKNALAEKFDVVVTDQNGDSSHTAIDVQIIDDTPESSGAQNLVIANPSGGASVAVSTNLVITLDVSGSMSGSKLTGAVDALESLIAQYQDNGAVRVQLTTFSTNATTQDEPGSGTGTWLTLDQATKVLNALKAGGYTNYEAAIAKTVAGDGPDAGTDRDAAPYSGENTQTVAYFVTDGAPTRELNSDGTSVTSISGTPVDAAYQTQWSNFIGSNVNQLYVVAVGANVNDTDLTNLASPDPLGAATSGTVIKVENVSQLLEELDKTVPTAALEPVVGTASLGIDIGADGWGSAKLSDVEAVGVTPPSGTNYNYVTAIAANGDSLIATSGGVQLVYISNSDGQMAAYRVTDLANGQPVANASAIFTVAIDQTTSSYTVTMNGSVDAYTVRSATQTGNWSTDTAATTAAAAAAPVELDIQQAIEQTVSRTTTETDSITLTVDNVAITDRSNGGSVTYTGTENGVTLTAVVSGSDDGDSKAVNVRNGSLYVGSESSSGKMDEDEKLSIAVTVTDDATTAGNTNPKITSVAIAAKDDESSDSSEKLKFNDGSETEVNDSWSTFTSATSNASSVTVTVEDTKNDFLVNDDIVVNYTYDKVTQETQPITENIYAKTTLVETRNISYTESAYDITLVYKVEATDGDGDAVDTVFHVTIDANNDGRLEAVDSGQVSAVVTEVTATETRTTTQQVYEAEDGTFVNVPGANPTTDVTSSGEVAGTPSVVTVVDTESAGADAARVTALNAAIDEERSTDPESVAATTLSNDAEFTENDVLQGSADNETLVGGDGDDVLIGGGGDDVFKFELADSTADTDTITDFEAGDAIKVADLLPDAAEETALIQYLPASADASTQLTSDTNGTTPDGTGDQTIVVNGTTAQELHYTMEADLLKITKTDTST